MVNKYTFDYRQCDDEYLTFSQYYVDKTTGQLNFDFDKLQKAGICKPNRDFREMDCITNNDIILYYGGYDLNLSDFIYQDESDFLTTLKETYHIYTDRDKEPLADGVMVREKDLVSLVSDMYTKDDFQQIVEFARNALSQNGLDPDDVDDPYNELLERFWQFCCDFYHQDHNYDMDMRQWLNEEVMYDGEDVGKLQLLVKVENFFNSNKYMQKLPFDKIYIESYDKDEFWIRFKKDNTFEVCFIIRYKDFYEVNSDYNYVERNMRLVFKNYAFDDYKSFNSECQHFFTIEFLMEYIGVIPGFNISDTTTLNDGRKVDYLYHVEDNFKWSYIDLNGFILDLSNRD